MRLFSINNQHSLNEEISLNSIKINFQIHNWIRNSNTQKSRNQNKITRKISIKVDRSQQMASFSYAARASQMAEAYQVLNIILAPIRLTRRSTEWPEGLVLVIDPKVHQMTRRSNKWPEGPAEWLESPTKSSESSSSRCFN